MRAWAVQLAGDAATDEEKARRLFAGLEHHLDIGKHGGLRTALQTFADWKKPDVAFTCQEYTFLYLVLARDLGLKCWYVLVNKDYTGTVVDHACACVVIGGKALLVDPTYQWFGCSP